MASRRLHIGRRSNATSRRQPPRRFGFGTGSDAGETVFEFQYGDDAARYWVYALRVCDLNADGRDDLMFYAGDDTSDVTIEFTNTGGTLAETKRYTTEGE